MGDRDYLFSKVDWVSVDQHQRKQLSAEIDALNGDRLLNTSAGDLCDYFEEKYQIEVPVLRQDEIVADQRESQIDVSHDHGRYISDRNIPFYIKGTAIEITIPFDGDAEAFRVQPTTYTLNPPRGEVRDGSLILRVEGANLTADQVRGDIVPSQRYRVI